MTQDELKQLAARAALTYIGAGDLIGVGTGSSTDHFIDALAAEELDIRGAVPSSQATARRLKDRGLPLLDLGEAGRLSVYVDGADAADRKGQLMKGGGGALTREKIVAAASHRFVCIIDESKLVPSLGGHPLAIEVIPLARPYVEGVLARMGGQAVLRAGFVTDNGNEILDVRGLDLTNPVHLEAELDHVAGVVCNGLFARRPADVVLVGTPRGVETLP